MVFIIFFESMVAIMLGRCISKRTNFGLLNTKVLNNFALSSHFSKSKGFDVKNVFENKTYDLNHVRGLIDHFNKRGTIPKKNVLRLLRKSTKYLQKLPNVIEISIDADETSRINVCGDTHGQYADFQSIFSETIGGLPSPKNMYLFNGDMVDRGRYAFEIMTVLLFTMLASPNTMYILRGNHETRSMYRSYGFETEILWKFDSEVFEKFEELFNALPIAAVIEQKVFVTHGGLSFLEFLNLII
jgi:serine/threonine-protein phosphatase 5